MQNAKPPFKFCFPVASVAPSPSCVQPTAPKEGICFPLPRYGSSGICSGIPGNRRMDLRNVNPIHFCKDCMGGARWLWKLLLSPPPAAQTERPRLDSHVVERAPAAVGVSRAQALPAGRVLLAGLHGHPGHLRRKQTHGLSAPRHAAGKRNKSSSRCCLTSLSNTIAIHKLK